MPLSIRSTLVSARRARRTTSQRAARAATIAGLRAPTFVAVPMRPELKTARSNLLSDFPSISSAWTEHSMLGISQGVTTSARVGNKIALYSFELHGVLSAGASGTAADDPYNVVRIIVAMWQQSVADTPLQLYYSYDTSSINAPINRQTEYIGSKLIKKYYDQYVPLEVTSTERGSGDGYAPGLAKVDLYVKFKKPIVVEYATSASTISGSYGPDKNLVISCVSDSTTVPNPGFIAGYAQVKYTDV